MSAADAYRARIDTVAAQQSRLGREVPDRWSRSAARFRADPHRPYDETLRAVADYLRPDDVLVDVGGGAGRLGLPLAAKCRELVNVEPAAGMQEAFAASAAEAGLTNVRAVQAAWPAAPAVEGEVLLAAHVTYFVREIVPFLHGLSEAARRRVILVLGSVPPPNMNAALYRLAMGEEQAPVPSHAELLPVLWDLGILPDIRMLRQPPTFPVVPVRERDAAIEGALATGGFAGDERAIRVLNERFDELFTSTPGGFIPGWTLASRTMLITWETGSGSG